MTLIADLRSGLRLWLRRPGIALPAVLSLAVGLAAGTSIFAIASTVLWRPLPLPASSDIFWVSQADRGAGDGVSPGVFSAWSSAAQSVGAVGALRPAQSTVQNDAGTDSERIAGTYATSGIFRVLSVPAVIGRTIDDADDRPGAAPVVVISHRLWQTRYNSRTDIIDRTVRIDGTLRTIVGVMPAELDQIPFGFDWWAPLALTASQAANVGPRYLDVIARVSPERRAGLEGELSAIAQRAGSVGDTGLPLTTRAVALKQYFSSDARPILLPLLGAVLAIVLIAAANAGNLLLVHGEARRAEIAVRASLGASRARLVQQFLAESAWLTAAAAALGLLVAQWMIDALSTVLPLDPAAMSRVRVDWRAGLFTIGLATLVMSIAGVLPAVRNSAFSLRQASRAVVGGHDRLRRAFVVVQVALALTLGMSAALMGRTVLELSAVPRGYDDAQVLTAALQLSSRDYPTAPRLRTAIDDVVAAAQRVPGVKAAAIATRVPLSGGAPGSDVALTTDEFAPGVDRQVRVRFVTPGYFSALGIPVAKGRDISWSDDENGPLVVMVNDTLARRLTGSDSPVGKPLKFEVEDFNVRGARTEWEIVGVVSDTRDGGPRAAVEPEAYLPMAQGPTGVFDWIGRQVLVAVRSDGQTTVDAAALRRSIAAVQPGLALFDVQTLQDRFSRHVSTERVMAGLLAPLGVIGFSLAAFGIATVLLQFVISRRREIAVRLALGATPAEMMRTLLFEGLRLAAYGTLLGLAGAAGTGRALESLVFGVTTLDPSAVAIVLTATVLTTLLAVWLPARRARAIDPAELLRGD